MPSVVAAGLYDALFSSARVIERADALTIVSAPGRTIAWIVAFLVLLPVSLWCWRRRIGGHLAPGVFFASFTIPLIVVPGIATESIEVSPSRIALRTGFWFAPTRRVVALTGVTEIVEKVRRVARRRASRRDRLWEFHYRDARPARLALTDLFDAQREHVVRYLRAHGVRFRGEGDDPSAVVAGDPDPLISGLDHIPVAVSDLDAAAEQYRRLGFTLKEGRPHANGIRNRHVKFADGSAIELITAAEARDALSGGYMRHLADGDGPAFVALYAPSLDRLAGALDAAERRHERAQGVLTFPAGDSLHHIFFGARGRSPTDRPEHFAHANGAEALVGVWLAADDLSAERDLLEMLGATITEGERAVPEPANAGAATFPDGEIVLLPASRRLVPGRRIVGATIRTRSLAALREAMARAGLDAPSVRRTPRGTSVVLPPDLAHGLWLEFLEPRDAR